MEKGAQLIEQLSETLADMKRRRVSGELTVVVENGIVVALRTTVQQQVVGPGRPFGGRRLTETRSRSLHVTLEPPPK